MSKELAILLSKRVVIEGLKAVAEGAGILALRSMVGGDLKKLTVEDLVRGKVLSTKD